MGKHDETRIGHIVNSEGTGFHNPKLLGTAKPWTRHEPENLEIQVFMVRDL
jgi:hypothetical protein